MIHPVKITIEGRPHSKKNSRQARTAYNFKKRKSYHFTVPGENYEDFKADALKQLLFVRERFSGAVVIDYIFYKKGNGLQDVDNAICSINDVLQESKVITDDKFVMLGSYEIVPGGDVWKTEIIIEELESDHPIWIKHKIKGWVELLAIDFPQKEARIKQGEDPEEWCNLAVLEVYQARLRRQILGKI